MLIPSSARLPLAFQMGRVKPCMSADLQKDATIVTMSVRSGRTPVVSRGKNAWRISAWVRRNVSQQKNLVSLSSAAVVSRAATENRPVGFVLKMISRVVGDGKVALR